MKKPVFSFRLDKDILDAATNVGIDVPRFIETTLAAAAKIKKCPTCGKKISEGK